MAKRLQEFFLATILAALVIGTTATYAKADTYRAGEFTITLDQLRSCTYRDKLRIGK